jgi:hypothetical protein
MDMSPAYHDAVSTYLPKAAINPARKILRSVPVPALPHT